jgi:hypothetical protein
MRFRSSIVAMMSPPVKAVREPYLWLCPVDTPEVAHKMKAIVTAYNLPFLFPFTFYRTSCGLQKRKRNHSRGMETRHLTNNHGANLLHRFDIQRQEKHTRFSWNSRQSAFPPSVVLRRKQKPGQIVCVLILASPRCNRTVGAESECPCPLSEPGITTDVSPVSARIQQLSGSRGQPIQARLA